MIPAERIARAIETLSPYQDIVLNMTDGRMMYIFRTGTADYHPDLTLHTDAIGYSVHLTDFTVRGADGVIELGSEGNKETRVTIRAADIAAACIVKGSHTTEVLR